MIVHILEEGIEILEIAFYSPRLWRREKNSRNFYMYREGKEIPKIANDNPRFWRRDKKS